MKRTRIMNPRSFFVTSFFSCLSFYHFGGPAISYRYGSVSQTHASHHSGDKRFYGESCYTSSINQRELTNKLFAQVDESFLIENSRNVFIVFMTTSLIVGNCSFTFAIITLLALFTRMDLSGF
mgnify:CR=1 FL=1|jgi:hypothetical protein